MSHVGRGKGEERAEADKMDKDKDKDDGSTTSCWDSPNGAVHTWAIINALWANLLSMQHHLVILMMPQRKKGTSTVCTT